MKLTPNNLNKNYVDITVRLLVLILFATILYFHAYRPAKEHKLYSNPVVAAAIAGANEGYPYTYKWDEDQFVPLGDFPNRDTGFSIMVTTVSVIGRVFNNNFMVSNETIYDIIYFVFFITMIVFLMPNLPLLISLGGALALTTAVYYGGLNFAYGQQWGAAYATLVTAMFVSSLPLLHRRWLDGIYLLGIISLITLSKWIRQEGTLTIYTVILAWVGLSILTMAITRWVIGEYGTWKDAIIPTIKRFNMPIIILLVMMFSSTYIVRGMFSLALGTPYLETNTTEHGSGHNVFIGLGTVTNPYNIAWLDNVGHVYSLTMDAEIGILHDEYHPSLLSEWARIIKENPALLISNIQDKWNVMPYYLDSDFASLPSEPDFNTKLARYPSIITQFPLLILAGSFIFILWSSRLDLMLVWGAYLTLYIASFFAPLLVYPAYLTALRGALVSIFFILPATLTMKQNNFTLTTVINRRIMIYGTILLLIVAILGGGIGVGWYNHANTNYQQSIQDFTQSDNISAQFDTLGYRFSHYFNAINRGQQSQILENIYDSSELDTFTFKSQHNDPQGLFDPILLIRTDDNIFVVAWHGENKNIQHELSSPFFLGFVNYFLTVCGDCDVLSQEYFTISPSMVQVGINNLFWTNDSYRMYSLPLASEMIDASSFLVGVQQIINGPGGEIITQATGLLEKGD